MTTGLRLENLARVIHADKRRTFAQECFVRQIELAQVHVDQAIYKTNRWTTIKC